MALVFLQGCCGPVLYSRLQAGRDVVALLLFGLLWSLFPQVCRLAGLLWPCCCSGCCGPESWLAGLAGWAAVAQAVCTFALACWQGCCDPAAVRAAVALNSAAALMYWVGLAGWAAVAQAVLCLN